MHKVGFIVNKKARKKESFYKAFNSIKREFNFGFNILETSGPGGGISLAKAFCNDGYSHIIAVGGDGTLNETVNGVIGSGGTAKIGALPYGTANDFKNSMGLPNNLKELAQAIKNNWATTIKTGIVHYHTYDKTPSTRYFINIADLGIGADVVRRVDKARKRPGPNLTFMSAILQAFFTFKNVQLTCQTGEWKWAEKANSVVIANGKYFGSGLCIAPDADPKSENFQIVLTGDVSVKDYLKNLLALKKGKRIKHPLLEYRNAAKIGIISNEHPCAIECDGEFLGYTPVSIEAGKPVDIITMQ